MVLGDIGCKGCCVGSWWCRVKLSGEQWCGMMLSGAVWYKVVLGCQVCAVLCWIVIGTEWWVGSEGLERCGGGRCHLT